jgi:arabinan endo-1,5-alpha-L-arabinosidase
MYHSVFAQTIRKMAILTILLLNLSACSKNLNIAQPEQETTNEPLTPRTTTLTNVSVRDPAMIFVNGTYYLFGTGKGIKVWSSTDQVNWELRPAVFISTQAWTNAIIPGFNNDIWAPEITYFKGQYYLFYAVSNFGTNNSAIAYATNTTLDSKSDNYKWIDHGLLIESSGTSWNAIDPNFVVAENNQPHLLLGSFFSGIKITDVTVDPANLKAAIVSKPTLANRDLAVNPYNAIEAPFVFKHNKYYYLFASINNCCSGINSDYKTIVGRSTTIDGPYTDKRGREMATGGGELVLEGNDKWHGAGGASIYNFKGEDKIVYFSYDNHGVERLRISAIKWDKNEWPYAVFTDN